MTFSVVAEYGSVSKAAVMLNLSQPAVSGQLRALQEQVGQALYERRARGIVLTPAGEQLLPYAHAVARNIRQVTEQIHELQQRPERILRIGLSYALSMRVAPLASQAAEHGLRLQISADTSANLVQQVLDGSLDGAQVVSPISFPEKQLDVYQVGGDELRLIVPKNHALGFVGYTPLAALQKETLLWAALGSGVRRQAERLLESAGVVSKRTLELGSIAAVRDGVLGGYGVAILPLDYMKYEVEAGLVHAVGLEALHTSVQHLFITAPAKVIGPEVRSLLEMICGHTQ